MSQVLRDAEMGLDAIIAELNALRLDDYEGATIVWHRESRTWAVCLKGYPWTEGKRDETIGQVCLRAKREARQPQVAPVVATEEDVAA